MASLEEIQRILSQIRDELPLLVQRSQIAPQQIVIGEGLSDIDRRMGLLQAGEFRAGNGVEPGLGFSGVRIGYPAFLYESTLWHIVGINDDTLQFGLRASDGVAVFGGSVITLSSSGIRIRTDLTEAQENLIIWENTSGLEAIVGAYNGGTMDVGIETTGSPVLSLYAVTENSVARIDLAADQSGDITSITTRADTFTVKNEDNNVTFASISATGTSLDGALVVNEAGADKDIRIEGDTDVNLLFTDASTDRVGIGTATPDKKLHVNGTAKVTSLVWDGWVEDTNTWSYSSADDPTFVISVNADMTALIGVGDRIKLTQTTAKYFIVTAVGSFSGGATLITVYGGTDYDLANAAITSPFYSHTKAPFGFPMSPAKWTVQVTDTTQRSQASPVQNTWYNLGSVSISIPIGVWRTSVKATLQGNLSSAADLEVQSTLSTANNSESDADYTSVIYGFVQALRGAVYVEKILTLAAKTSYYYNTRTTVASVNTIYNVNDLAKLIINAECAYL